MTSKPICQDDDERSLADSAAAWFRRAIGEMTLDRRATLPDLVAPIALDLCDVPPLTGSGRIEERDLRGGLAQPF